MKKIVALFALIAILLAPLVAFSPDTELVPAGHWVYDALDYLFADVGETSIAVSAPASHFEIRTYLGAIPYAKLSPQGLRLFRKVQSYVGARTPIAETGAASFDLRPVISLSARYHGSDDAFFAFDRTASFNATKPVVSLPLELSFTPYVTGVSELSVGEGYWAFAQAKNYSNIPDNTSYVDMNWPKTAYLSAGNSFCTAVIGRGAVSYGRALSGSMILSGEADRLNYVSLSMFAPGVRYTMMPIELAPDRFAYYHNVSIKPLPFLSLTFSEGSLVNSTLDIRYLNPFMIFHGYSGWLDRAAYGYSTDTEDVTPVGSQLGTELTVIPMRGLKLYGQFAMNQFQTTYEVENWGDGAAKIPNALGGIAGLRYSHPIAGGFLSASLEGVYANPWLYIMNNKSISWYWTRHELVLPTGVSDTEVSGWLGSPYGPDTIAGIFNVRYEDFGDLQIGATYRFVCKGENGDSFLAFKETSESYYYPTTVAAATITTPSGTPRYQHMGLLEVSKTLGSFELSGYFGYAVMTGKVNAQSPFGGIGGTWNVR